MSNVAANLLALQDDDTSKERFTKRLAVFCNAYVMEVAKPIMEHRSELYEDKAIVKLVNLWFNANRKCEHGRQTYLVQWAANKENGYDFEPLESYKWADEERKTYRDALYALLIG